MKRNLLGVNEMIVRTKRLGYRERQDHGHTLQERQGSVLTNQCLGKETNAEGGAEELIVQRNWGHTIYLRLLPHHNHDGDGKTI